MYEADLSVSVVSFISSSMGQMRSTKSPSLELFSERTSSIQRNGKLKDQASFFSCYEVCLIRIKEQIGEKRSTVCTHRYADCLLKNTSTKHIKYVVNQKLEHIEDISFRELFGRIRVVFYKIRFVSSQHKNRESKSFVCGGVCVVFCWSSSCVLCAQCCQCFWIFYS